MACSKRGDGDSCAYSNSGRSGRGGHNEPSRASEAHSRLQKLEKMVTCLMLANKNNSISGPAASQGDSVDERLRSLSIEPPSRSSQPALEGYLDIHGSETQYVGATNWATILENVCDRLSN